MKEVTTIQIYREDLDKLNSRAKKTDNLRDILSNCINGTDKGDFEEAHVPEGGRFKLSKAAGKTIEWRVKS